jgi:hypothetical protein
MKLLGAIGPDVSRFCWRVGARGMPPAAVMAQGRQGCAEQPLPHSIAALERRAVSVGFQIDPFWRLHGARLR